MKEKAQPQIEPTAKRKRRRSGHANATAQFEAQLARASDAQVYVLRLFVTGSSPRSSAAVAMIRSICDDYLAGNYELEVVDLYQRPEAAAGEQIVAAPTLIKQQPEPVRRMVGTLADRNRVLDGLEIPPNSHAAGPTATKRR